MEHICGEVQDWKGLIESTHTVFHCISTVLPTLFVPFLLYSLQKLRNYRTARLSWLLTLWHRQKREYNGSKQFLETQKFGSLTKSLIEQSFYGFETFESLWKPLDGLSSRPTMSGRLKFERQQTEVSLPWAKKQLFIGRDEGYVEPNSVWICSFAELTASCRTHCTCKTLEAYLRLLIQTKNFSIFVSGPWISVPLRL